jgi:hypothetical protein
MEKLSLSKNINNYKNLEDKKNYGFKSAWNSY